MKIANRVRFNENNPRVFESVQRTFLQGIYTALTRSGSPAMPNLFQPIFNATQCKGSQRKCSNEESKKPLPLAVAHYSYPFHFLYIFLCCSRNMNVATVCGPSLMKLGTQPLKTHPRPSLAVIRVIKLTMLS